MLQFSLMIGSMKPFEHLKTETTTSQSNFMNARNGKTAHLPREIPEELNHRLERSEPGPKLLAWLKDKGDVKYFMELLFWNVEADVDLLYKDTLEGEETDGEGAKPVKPSWKRHATECNRKSKSTNADKPLEEKGMEKEKGGGDARGKSRPVKQGQTDLQEPDEDGLGAGLGLRLGDWEDAEVKKLSKDADVQCGLLIAWLQGSASL